MKTTGRRSAGEVLLQPLPPILRPAAKAYLLGYASVVGPRILTLLLRHFSKGRRRRKGDASTETQGHRQRREFLASLKEILLKGLDPYRFPAFCAAMVGGSTILEVGRPACGHLPSSLAALLREDEMPRVRLGVSG